MSEQGTGDTHPDRINPDALYDQFPAGDEYGFGQAQGYARTVRINDPRYFEAWFDDPDVGPTLRAFCGLDDEDGKGSPIRLYVTRFKSSTRESEYFIHKPVEYLAGYFDLPSLTPPGEEPIGLERLQSVVMNHERSLAWRRTFSMLVVDDKDGAQVLHKEN